MKVKGKGKKVRVKVDVKANASGPLDLKAPQKLSGAT